MENQSPGINVEKGIEVILRLKGVDFTGSAQGENWKKIQSEVVGKEIEFKQSLVEFNHYKVIDDKAWKIIDDIMLESELDQKIIKYQTNPASALITWANASYHLIT